VADDFAVEIDVRLGRHGHAGELGGKGGHGERAENLACRHAEASREELTVTFPCRNPTSASAPQSNGGVCVMAALD
jgi:hypothetical protein